MSFSFFIVFEHAYLLKMIIFQPGSDLAAELGVTAQDDVLFAVFSSPDSSEGVEISFI